METVSNLDIDQTYKKLLDLEPNLITVTVPSNATDEKKRFLSGETRNPDHVYPKLKIADGTMDEIARLTKDIIGSSALDSKYKPVYEAFGNDYMKKTRLIQLMDNIKTAPTDEERDAARQEFMRLNAEVYGEPDRATYMALISEKLASIDSALLKGNAARIYEELMGMLPEDVENHSGVATDRFKPSEETLEWMQQAVETLYAPMLARVPEDKEAFTVADLQAIFTEIISAEFGEAAEGWRVDIEPAKAITVKAVEKRIVIPEDRKDMDRDTVRKLFVHEVGVHMFRSVTGSQTDLGPLSIGLEGYYDFEEGLGAIMEQALSGKFREAGVDAYITIGAAYFDEKDFRDTFEMKWRLAALTKLSEGHDLTEEAIEAAKTTAYGTTMRIFRGTDELPWFKDLGYFTGAAKMWEFLESIRGDDFQLTLLLMGRIGAEHNHLSTVLESKTP